jgi:hypothetical protein
MIREGAKIPYSSDAAEVLRALNTDAERGLARSEAARRLGGCGPNELEDRGGKGSWSILLEQFTSLMVAILIVAAVVSAALGDYEDSAAIAVIVTLNTALGFTQEYRAERAMAALKKMSVPIVKVRREGHVGEISARELVPGDVVLLEAGGDVVDDALRDAAEQEPLYRAEPAAAHQYEAGPHVLGDVEHSVNRRAHSEVRLGDPRVLALDDVRYLRLQQLSGAPLDKIGHVGGG